MQISHEDMATIQINIWSSMLGLDIRPTSELPDLPENVATITGCVQIGGEWVGIVLVQCQRSLASKAAGILFDLPESELGDDEIRDVLGELTNMTAGNIKTILPEGCHLAIPLVTAGTDYRLTVPGGKVLIRAGYIQADEPFLVTVFGI